MVEGPGVSEFLVRLIVPGDRVIEFHGPADITLESTDAIVNAANSSLMGGGGVDGAIHHAGGPSILQECERIVAEMGSLPAGKAVITGAGRLPAKYVIHTVGPIYRGGDRGEPATLASCYRECFRLAEELELQSLSFPSISTGAYAYPVEEAAPLAVATVVETLSSARCLRRVRFVLFDRATLKAYVRGAEQFCQTKPSGPYRLVKSPS